MQIFVVSRNLTSIYLINDYWLENKELNRSAFCLKWGINLFSWKIGRKKELFYSFRPFKIDPNAFELILGSDSFSSVVGKYSHFEVSIKLFNLLWKELNQSRSLLILRKLSFSEDVLRSIFYPELILRSKYLSREGQCHQIF